MCWRVGGDRCLSTCVCVHICRRMCTPVSRGTCLCLHTCVSVGTYVHLCPSPLCFCVLVCTWTSMRVSARRAGYLRDGHWRSRDSPWNPPVVESMEEAGSGKVPTQAAMRDFVCQSWGGVGGIQEVQLAGQMSPAGLHCFTVGSEFLGNDLESSLFPCPAPAHSPEKRKNQA